MNSVSAAVRSAGPLHSSLNAFRAALSAALRADQARPSDPLPAALQLFRAHSHLPHVRNDPVSAELVLAAACKLSGCSAKSRIQAVFSAKVVSLDELSKLSPRSAHKLMLLCSQGSGSVELARKLWESYPSPRPLGLYAVWLRVLARTKKLDRLDRIDLAKFTLEDWQKEHPPSLRESEMHYESVSAVLCAFVHVAAECADKQLTLSSWKLFNDYGISIDDRALISICDAVKQCLLVQSRPTDSKTIDITSKFKEELDEFFHRRSAQKISSSVFAAILELSGAACDLNLAIQIWNRFLVQSSELTAPRVFVSYFMALARCASVDVSVRTIVPDHANRAIKALMLHRNAPSIEILESVFQLSKELEDETLIGEMWSALKLPSIERNSDLQQLFVEVICRASRKEFLNKNEKDGRRLQNLALSLYEGFQPDRKLNPNLLRTIFRTLAQSKSKDKAIALWPFQKSSVLLTVPLCNSFLEVLSLSGERKLALSFFRQMTKRSNLKPSDATLRHLLKLYFNDSKSSDAERIILSYKVWKLYNTYGVLRSLHSFHLLFQIQLDFMTRRKLHRPSFRLKGVYADFKIWNETFGRSFPEKNLHSFVMTVLKACRVSKDIDLALELWEDCKLMGFHGFPQSFTMLLKVFKEVLNESSPKKMKKLPFFIYGEVKNEIPLHYSILILLLEISSKIQLNKSQKGLSSIESIWNEFWNQRVELNGLCFNMMLKNVLSRSGKDQWPLNVLSNKVTILMDQIQTRNLSADVTFFNMILKFSLSLGKEAQECSWRLFDAFGVMKNSDSYNVLLSQFLKSHLYENDSLKKRALNDCFALYSEMCSFGFSPNTVTLNTLLTVTTNFRLPDASRNVWKEFDLKKIPRTLVSYNLWLKILSESAMDAESKADTSLAKEFWRECSDIWKEIRKLNIKGNRFTALYLLRACEAGGNQKTLHDLQRMLPGAVNT